MKHFSIPKINLIALPESPHVVAALVFMGLLCLMALYCFTADDGQEMGMAFIGLFSFWINSALIVGASLVVAAAFMWNFKKGVCIRWEYGEHVPILPPFTLSPDMGVFTLYPMEPGERIADRLEAAIQQKRIDVGGFQQFTAHRVYYCAFREPVCIIHTGKGQMQFRRGAEPWNQPGAAVPDIDVMSETWEQYEAYLNRARRDFKAWSNVNTIEESSDPVQSVINLLRTPVTVILLLFCSFQMFGQKSAQVERYLGARYTMAAPTGEVRFIFQKMELVRQSDGKKTYKDLLPMGEYYTDEQNAGYLSAIHVKQGSVTMAINPTPPPKATQAATQTAIPVPTGDKPHRIDSLSVAQELDAAKTQVDKWRDDAWQVAKPMWEFVMFVFSRIRMVALLIMGILWFLAKVSSEESAVNMFGTPIIGRWLHSVHQSSAGLLTLLVWIVMIVVIIEAFLRIVYFDMPQWLIVVIFAIFVKFAQKIANWFIPNVRVIGGRGFNPGGDYPVPR